MQIVLITTLLAIVIETSFISLPFTFITLLFWAVTKQEQVIFPLAFFSGLILDLLTFRQVGLSSACLLILVFGVFLYRSKFEIGTLGFFGVSAFLGSLIYLFISSSNHAFLGAIITAMVSIFSFWIFQSYNHKLKVT